MPIPSITDIESQNAALLGEFREFAQDKTDFQIEKFSIIAEGDVPSHNYRHALKQIEAGLYQVKQWLIDIEAARRKIKRLTDAKPEDYDLDILRAETQIEHLETKVLGRMRTITKYRECADYILKSNGGPFTAEQYQADEVAYYQQRLARQAIGNLHPFGAGNVTAILNAAAPPVLPDSPNHFNIPLVTQADQKALIEHLFKLAVPTRKPALPEVESD